MANSMILLCAGNVAVKTTVICIVVFGIHLVSILQDCGRLAI